MTKTSSPDVVKDQYDELTQAGRNALDRGGGIEGRPALINLPCTLRNSVSNAGQESAQNKTMTERLEEQVHHALMAAVTRSEKRYSRLHSDTLKIVSQPCKALVPCSAAEREALEAMVRSERCKGWTVDFRGLPNQSHLSVHNKTYLLTTPKDESFEVCLSVPERSRTAQQQAEVKKIVEICDDFYAVPQCNCGFFHFDWKPCKHIAFLKVELKRYVDSEEFKKKNTSYVIPPLIDDLRSYFTSTCRVETLRLAYRYAGEPITTPFTMEACVAAAAQEGFEVEEDDFAIVVSHQPLVAPPNQKGAYLAKGPLKQTDM